MAVADCAMTGPMTGRSNGLFVAVSCCGGTASLNMIKDEHSIDHGSYYSNGTRPLSHRYPLPTLLDRSGPLLYTVRVPSGH